MIRATATTGGTIARLMRQRIIPAAHRGVVKTVEQGKQSIERSMRGAKTGRLYGDHRASAPGESPAVDTGVLIGSLEVRQIGKHTVLLSAGTEYAVWLEFGTLNMAPRPFMRPAKRYMQERVGQNMRNEVRRSI